MLKPNDPAWPELVAEIKAVVSCRCDDGFAFGSLHRTEQRDFFHVSGFFNRYRDLGLSDNQEVAIINNVLDGKPQEKWFDGVFDREAETLMFTDILKGIVEDHLEHIQGQVYSDN